MIKTRLKSGGNNYVDLKFGGNACGSGIQNITTAYSIVFTLMDFRN